jgi:hypothetical protein
VVLGAVAGATSLLSCAYTPWKPDAELGSAWAVHHIEAEAIAESSGLVASRNHPGVFWTHNDSGDVPRLFAIDASGALLSEFRVAGATHRDWEDIAADDAGHLFVGDFGNNANDRRDLVIYRIPEPDPSAETRVARVDRALHFRFADQQAYPDPERRNFDVEALFWMDGALYFFTKHRSNAATKLYRLSIESSGAESELEPLARHPLPDERSAHMVTAADYQLVDGGLLALLTYRAIHLFEREKVPEMPDAPGVPDAPDVAFREIHRIELVPRRVGQTESLAWDGDALLFGNEQRALFRIPDPLAIERYPP